ncbi:response regulator [Phenylobacterium soli]|uniref:Response regulator n=1 Tax=Phenylobacterium soli TaxID=2170551 RepID=A0A328AM88_9CAUL|nr:response regulator [Phenylobacterium soli]RAK53998.1 response regulator [Phenylobacterium soli]
MDSFSPRPLVVVVDDDPAVRGSLTFSLELDGFDVEAFESGEALLLRQLPHRPTCLVLDQKLPGISGLEALRQLRDRKVSSPAILITSHPHRSVVAEAAEAGVPIVEKPLLGDALLRDIHRALDA